MPEQTTMPPTTAITTTVPDTTAAEPVEGAALATILTQLITNTLMWRKMKTLKKTLQKQTIKTTLLYLKKTGFKSEYSTTLSY